MLLPYSLPRTPPSAKVAWMTPAQLIAGNQARGDCVAIGLEVLRGNLQPEVGDDRAHSQHMAVE